jgi:hypothetical protein
MSAGPPVCVLGFGRSGTSLAARVLNLLGVDLGPEDRMLPASELNEAGFWEQAPIMELNEAILQAFGGTYGDPPAFPAGWIGDPRAASLRTRMGELLAELFPGDGRWGFKDPRTVDTLPLWQDVVGEMVYVICARDPYEVAASHQVGWPEYDTEHYVDLWLRANAAALRETAGLRRVVVLHHEWFEAPETVVRRLQALLHAPVDDDRFRAAVATVRPELRRQRSQGDRLEERADVAIEIRAMAAVLEGMAIGGADSAPALPALGATLDREWRERHRREGDLWRAHMAAEEAGERARTEHAAAEERLAAISKELAELRQKLTATAAERDEVRAALGMLESSRSWRLTAPLRGAAGRVRRD